MYQDVNLVSATANRHPSLIDPWEAALTFGAGTVMALLTDTQGPAYRNKGAAMAIAPDGRFAGGLSSGCIESDIILHAQTVRANGMPKALRYGERSPFFDLRLPCGGAIEVLLFPVTDLKPLQILSYRRAHRIATVVTVSDSGVMELGRTNGFSVNFEPPLRFVIFGAGAEASLFADLVRSLDYEHIFLSHEDQSLATAQAIGCKIQHMGHLPDIERLVPDARCAAVLFYHDHDYEPQILRQLLSGPAFYIGAQGSRRTQESRLARLAEMGVDEITMRRVRGPIGLVPSAREPRQLAVSVLAEILQAAGDPVHHA